MLDVDFAVEVRPAIHAMFGQFGDRQNRDQNRTAKQNYGLDGLGHHHGAQPAHHGVDGSDDRDDDDRHLDGDAEELLEHFGPRVKRDADVDQHGRQDGHEGHDGTGETAVAFLKKLGQRVDPATEVEWRKDQRTGSR